VIGAYDPSSIKFNAMTTPRLLDFHSGFYASKSFRDDGPAPKINDDAAQQLLWGWVKETSPEPPKAGWAGTNSFPRALLPILDLGVIATPPSRAIEQLRSAAPVFKADSIAIKAGDWRVIAAPADATADVSVSFSLDNLSDEARANLKCWGARSMPEAPSGLPTNDKMKQWSSDRANNISSLCSQAFEMADSASSGAMPSYGVSYLSTTDGTCQTRAEITHVPATPPLNNTDMPGGDYRDYGLPASAPEDDNIRNCSLQCAMESQCVAWTYVRNGGPSDGYPVPRCSLKSTIPASNSNQWCVSGTVSAVTMSQNTQGSCGGDSRIETGPVPMKMAEAFAASPSISLRVLVDHSIGEAFAMGGRTAITARAYPSPPSDYGNATAVAIWAKGEDIVATSVTVWTLSSAYA